MPKILIMKDEKWVLPSGLKYRESLPALLKYPVDEIDFRKQLLETECKHIAESDLTASLDLLERLKAICEAEIPEFNMPDLNTFLQTFRK